MKQIKVPKPRQLDSGNWFVRVTLPDGKRHPITRPTEAECIAAAMALKQALIAAEDKSRKPTLSEAIDQYIAERENLLSPATIRGYRIIQRNRFTAAMNKPIDAFDEKGWKRLVNNEAAVVAIKTVRNAWGLVSPIIEEHMGRKYKVNIDKPVKAKAVTTPTPFLPWNEIKQFLAAARGSKYEIASLLALHSLRCSELTALTWDKIDLKKNVIIVEGAIVPNEDNKYVYKDENKNETSSRVVPIMIPRLRELLDADPKTSEKVVPYHARSILRGVQKICEQAGVTVVGIHGLRHSYASLAWRLGIPSRVAQIIGGWRDSSTMEKIYTHVSKIDVITYENKMTAFYESEDFGNDFGNDIFENH